MLSPFTTIDCAKTALLGVDMQHGFVAPGEAASVPRVAEIIPSINAMAGALRPSGGCVAYLRHLVDQKAVRDWSTYYENLMLPERVSALKEAMTLILCLRNNPLRRGQGAGIRVTVTE